MCCVGVGVTSCLTLPFVCLWVCCLCLLVSLPFVVLIVVDVLFVWFVGGLLYAYVCCLTCCIWCFVCVLFTFNLSLHVWLLVCVFACVCFFVLLTCIECGFSVCVDFWLVGACGVCGLILLICVACSLLVVLV